MPGHDLPPLNDKKPAGNRIEDLGDVAAHKYRRSPVPKFNQYILQRDACQNVQSAIRFTVNAVYLSIPRRYMTIQISAAYTA